MTRRGLGFDSRCGHAVSDNERCIMRKAFIAFALLIAAVFGSFGAGPAAVAAPTAAVQQTTVKAAAYVDMTELLECYVDGERMRAYVYYSVLKETDYNPDQWQIHGTSGSAYPGPIGSWVTTAHFNADRLDIDLEVAPGIWEEVLHKGGYSSTQNDVAVEGTWQSSRYWHISDASSTPQWRLQVWGGPGNSTNSCHNYGNV